MAVFSHLPGGGGFYPHLIDQSCRFNALDTPGMTRSVWAGAGNQQHTFSTWVKKCSPTGDQLLLQGFEDVNNFCYYWFGNPGYVGFKIYVAAAFVGFKYTTRLFRDVSSWFHIYAQFDSTSGTAADRFRLWINGVENTIWNSGTDVDIVLNTTDFFTDNGNDTYVGKFSGASLSLNGYIAETHFLPGDVSGSVNDFGVFRSGVWVPIRYTGSYNADGFHLDYSNSSHFGEDQSGNNNDLTDSGLATNDQVLDSPTNNYCTLNAVGQGTLPTLSNGNLQLIANLSGDWHGVNGTMSVSSGKWYWEVTVPDASHAIMGAGPDEDRQLMIADFPGVASGQIGYYHTGTIFPGNSAYGDPYLDGEIVSVLLDMDNGTVNFWNQGVDQGEAISGLSGSYCPSFAVYDGTEEQHVNFGQLPFTYTPPVGYKTLCSANLPEPEILEGDKGFHVETYTGTGAEKSITGMDFSPDLVWFKNRSNARNHQLYDTVRGATKYLLSNSTGVEGTDAQGLKSFDTDGFTVGTTAGVNGNGETLVTWCWKEDPRFGFDIVSYTGTGVAKTEAHNLGVVPEMMIVKNRETAAQPWIVYHKDMTATPEEDYLFLNDTDAVLTHPTIWNDTSPTSSVFTVGTDSSVNLNTKEFIAYLFASVEGFSKVFSYTGNGSLDGSFVYCGFRPRYILLKNTASAYNWWINDTARTTYNVMGDSLYADTAGAEAATTNLDLLSNGFKLRTNGDNRNENGVTFIGIAFAEHPFKYANAR